MKKEFPLKNLERIEIDHNNNMAIAIYSEEEPALEIGKWYGCGFEPRIYLGNNRGAGVDCGTWNDNIKMSKPKMWIKSDMDEVKRLLIGEAYKRGFNKGVIIVCDWNDRKTKCETKYTDLQNIHVGSDGSVQCWGYMVFDPKSGAWAEIKSEPRQITIDGVLYIEKNLIKSY